jgi:TolB protein
MKSKHIKWSLLVVIVLLAILWPKGAHDGAPDSPAIDEARSSGAHAAGRNPIRLHQRARYADENAEAKPQGLFQHVFDKSLRGSRFLLGKERDRKFLPNSDAPSGMDLWIQDSNGEERLVHESVTRARFSPDGTRIAFTTSDAELHVEDLSGNSIANVAGVYGPSWSPDGTAVIYAKVGEGEDPHRPGTRRLTTLHLGIGEAQGLTEGIYDDGRPEFNPSGEWVIYVSGARSGLASFWRVPANGGESIQLTNVGLDQVTDLFVPTPYEKTTWSADQRWFVYDFKSGERQETWGLEFNHDGTVKRATKLADGINPQLQSDGRTLICEKSNEEGVVETVISSLP